MGLKKIAELRKEAMLLAKSMEQFEGAANEFVQAYGKIQQAYDGVDKLRREKFSAIEKLDTRGVKEFEEFKNGLIEVYRGYGSQPLSIDPLRAAVKAKRKEVDDAVQLRIAKLAAAFPKQITKGMVFRSDITGVVWEIVSDGEQSKNVNLKTDDERLWFDKVDEKGTKTSISVADLKKNYKFIKV